MRAALLSHKGMWRITYAGTICIPLFSYLMNITREMFFLGLILIIFLMGREMIQFIKNNPFGNDAVGFSIFYPFFIIIGFGLFYILRGYRIEIGNGINPLWLGILIYIILSIYFGRWQDRLYGSQDLIYRRSLTRLKESNFFITQENFVKPLLYSLSILLIFGTHSAFTFNRNPFINYFRSIYIIIPVMIIILIFNSYLLGEVFWKCPESRLELTQVDSKLLDTKDFGALTEYFNQLKLYPEPPEDFVTYIREYYSTLAQSITQVNHIGILAYFVQAMDAWGIQARSILSYYKIIILSALKEHIMFGLIKINLRNLFAHYLFTLQKIGDFDLTWEELINYEISKKNRHFIKYFVELNKSTKYLHQGYIYCEGFGDLLHSDGIVNIQDDWFRDLKIIERELIPLLIGPDSRILFSDKIKLYHKIEHLAGGKLLDSYVPLTDRQFVHKEIEGGQTERKFTEEEAKIKMLEQLGLREPVIIKEKRIIELPIKQLLSIVLLLTINLVFLYILDIYNETAAMMVFGIEFMLLTMFSGLGREDKDNTVFQRKDELSSNHYQGINIDYRNSFNGFLYLILLILGFAFIFFS
ncbi:MAG: hypothetical protein INQ03_11035 [Candidatus Heimdallarchaeota archaeon]|nr:hypothetical protein [Candidatus Heimdallarchaeota archaeon]